MEPESQPASHALWKHGFLAFILCLIVFNVLLLIRMIRTDYPYAKYGGVVVALMLLFNHIAFYYTKTGLAGTIMKTVAFVWLALGCVYLGWVLMNLPGTS